MFQLRKYRDRRQPGFRSQYCSSILLGFASVFLKTFFFFRFARFFVNKAIIIIHSLSHNNNITLFIVRWVLFASTQRKVRQNTHPSFRIVLFLPLKQKIVRTRMFCGGMEAGQVGVFVIQNNKVNTIITSELMYLRRKHSSCLLDVPREYKIRSDQNG